MQSLVQASRVPASVSSLESPETDDASSAAGRDSDTTQWKALLLYYYV